MNNYLHSNEAARLETLSKYQFLQLDAEENFDEITKLAAYICGTPVALVSIVERDRQWFKSKIGWTAKETPREIAFCSQTILQKDLLIVEDALADQRFANNPLVILDPKIRFYAGAPLINVDGFAVGTLCVIDYVPRCLSSEQLTALKVLSRQVMMQLELDRYSSQSLRNQTERQYAELTLKKTYDELNERNAELGKTKQELQNTIAQLQVAQQELHQRQQELSVSDDAIRVQNLEHKILFWNKGSEAVYGWAVDEAIGKDADQLLYKKNSPEFAEIHEILFQKGNWQGELHQVRKDGKEIVVSSRWTLMRDDHNQPKSILIVNTDITEKKKNN